LDNQNSCGMSHDHLHDSHATVAIMSSSLVGVCTVRGRPNFTCAINLHLQLQLHFLPHGDNAPITKTHYSLGDVDHDKIARIPEQQHQPVTGTKDSEHVTVLIICTFHVHLITINHC
jgi:hypothetical protein